MIQDVAAWMAASQDGYLEHLGPLRPLIEDDGITEIMVVGADGIFVERGGSITPTDLRFHDENQLLEVIQLIVASGGRRVDAANPSATRASSTAHGWRSACLRWPSTGPC